MYEITMPRLSDSMEEGKIIQWKVKEGQDVHAGDILAEIESDKAVMELENFHDGRVAKIVKPDGAEVPVGEVIALIASKIEAAAPAAEPKKETAPAAAPAVATPPAAAPAEPARKSAEPAKKAPVSTEPPKKPPTPAEPAEEPPAPDESTKEAPAPAKPETPPTPAEAAKKPPAPAEPAEEAPAPASSEKPPAPSASSPPHRIAISPYARRLAESRDIDYTRIKGTGDGGRIMARDIEAVGASAAAKPATSPASATEQKPPAARPPDEELPPLELAEGEADVEDASFRLKTQARRTTAAKHVIPHFYITVAADVTRLLQLRAALKVKNGATVTHLVMLACLKAIAHRPEINRSYDRGRVIRWKNVNLGLAVDTDEGLTVAVLAGAQNLALPEIIAKTSALAERARTGHLAADERRHPTFTISNLGMFDVEHFAPILNPPSAITLGVASAADAPVIRDGGIYIGKVMRLTASCDHRIIDGAAAARFLKELKNLLENPQALIEEPA